MASVEKWLGAWCFGVNLEYLQRSPIEEPGFLNHRLTKHQVSDEMTWKEPEAKVICFCSTWGGQKSSKSSGCFFFFAISGMMIHPLPEVTDYYNDNIVDLCFAKRD